MYTTEGPRLFSVHYPTEFSGGDTLPDHAHFEYTNNVVKSNILPYMISWPSHARN